MNREEIMGIIQSRLYEYHIPGLSERTGISTGCLYYLRNGKTQWPRHATLFTLLPILDLELTVRDIRNARSTMGGEAA